MMTLVSRIARLLIVIGLCCSTAMSWARQSTAPVSLTFTHPQMAGISGFRAMWDTPVVLAEDGTTEMRDRGEYGKGLLAMWDPAKRQNGALPGAPVFDAVHRSLLVRFPGMAAAIAEHLTRGYAVQKVELVLPFRDTELWPEGYADPAGLSMLGDLWARVPPQWHAVAWALRRPWVADPQLGPTFNASLNGAGNWTKYGAQDTETDRYPRQFGPTEVSCQQPEGHMDVTALLTDPSYGKARATRLRRLEDNGFLVRKWEYYDARYLCGGYEWGTATGGRGILIHAPKLVVTLIPKEHATVSIPLPQAPDLPQLAVKLRASGKGGPPTAVMPGLVELKQLATQYGFNRPAWMPDWQWQRVQELRALGGEDKFPDTPEAFDRWIDDMLAIVPRRWDGFDAAEKIQNYMQFADAWPAPVRDHWKLYWTAWLMPDNDIKALVHPWIETDKIIDFYKQTGDWRGNTNFYRPYCYNLGTMSINHTAVVGSLLGGTIIGSQQVMADGRHGLEFWPLRTWCWFDGTTPESIDHADFAATLKDQKLYADFGPTYTDRMMGHSLLAKSIEELTSCYHPALHRFISTSGHGGPAEFFCLPDGLQYIMHTLSHTGALHDSGMRATNGMPVVGQDASPGSIAQQTLHGPWAPEWVANMLDEKPLPYEITMADKKGGRYAATPLWKRSYLGHHYGLSTLDVASGNESTPVMAQWQREAKPVAKIDELGTLTLKFGVNATPLLASNGSPDGNGGYPCALQYRNKAIILTSPEEKLDDPLHHCPAEVRSVQTTIGLFTCQQTPSWQLYVDGQEVTALPYRMKDGQRITIHDGVSYLGIIPLPSTDCGRTEEVIISAGGTDSELRGGGQAKEAVRITQYQFKADTPLDKATADWTKINQAYGGVIIELADNTEYADFAAFQQHMRETKLETRWEVAATTLHVAYHSGADTLECGFNTTYTGNTNNNTPTDQCFPYRRVNGQWPYLPAGIDRDSTLTQQGTTGRLEKNGAILTCEPGHMAYLQTEPISGSYAGYNPFSDPIFWSLHAPDGVVVRADGKLAMTRVIVRPKENKLWIDYGALPKQTGAELATALLVFGLTGAPTVERNGKLCSETFTSITVDGQQAYVIPLTDNLDPRAVQQVAVRYQRVPKE